MKMILILLLTVLSSCAHKSRCQNSENQNAVYFDGPSCKVRIRQGVIISKLGLTKKIEPQELASYELEWVSESMESDVISQGHYKLVKKTSSESKQDYDE